MHAVRGVAQLGAEANDPRYLEWAKAAYQHYSNYGFDTGWRPSPVTGTITRTTTTTVKCAWWPTCWKPRFGLPAAGWPGYWDRVDRTIRNVVVPGQFVLTPKLEGMWREINKDRTPAEADRSSSPVEGHGGRISERPDAERPRLRGQPQRRTTAAPWSIADTEIVCDMMGCCPPEGMRAVYFAWRDTVRETPEGIMVNLAFDRDAPQASVRSAMPRQGATRRHGEGRRRFSAARAGLGASIGGAGPPQRQARGCLLGRAGHGLRPLSAGQAGRNARNRLAAGEVYPSSVSHKIYGGTAERSTSIPGSAARSPPSIRPASGCRFTVLRKHKDKENQS